MHAASSLLTAFPALTRVVIILRLLFYFVLAGDVGCDKNEEQCGFVPADLSLRRACFFISLPIFFFVLSARSAVSPKRFHIL